MPEWLSTTAGQAVVVIHAMAIIIVVLGTIQAFVASVRGLASRSLSGHAFRDDYVHYARWLVAGLTFQLAADIIESAIAPGWEEILRLGAIAAIRTFLNYFLERDLAEAARRQGQSRHSAEHTH